MHPARFVCGNEDAANIFHILFFGCLLHPVLRIGMAAAPSLLLVDDDEVFRGRLAVGLRSRGFRVVPAGSNQAAREAAAREPFEHAVVDLRLPDSSGLDLVSWLQEHSPGTRALVLTGFGSIATAVEAMRLGAHHYLSKPVDADEIVEALKSPTPSAGERAARPPSLARAEWEHIQRVLADCGGNISESARRLQITRRTLQLKLKRTPPRY